MFIINAFFFKSFGSEDTKPTDREGEPMAVSPVTSFTRTIMITVEEHLPQTI